MVLNLSLITESVRLPCTARCASLKMSEDDSACAFLMCNVHTITYWRLEENAGIHCFFLLTNLQKTANTIK